MSRINSDLKIYSAVWDFAVEGGAIGTMLLGAALPPGFCVAMATAYIINQPTSAAASKIAFGITGPGANALFPNTPYTDWASDNVFFTTDPTDGFNFQNPVLPNGGELTFSVFVAPLTGGKIVISVFGTQFGAGI